MNQQTTKGGGHLTNGSGKAGSSNRGSNCSPGYLKLRGSVYRIVSEYTTKLSRDEVEEITVKLTNEIHRKFIND